MHTVGLYNKLRQKGYHTVILVAEASKFDHYLTAQQIPHYTTRAYNFRNGFWRPFYHVVLKNNMRFICKKENISTITCNCTPEVSDAMAIKKACSVQVVFTRHCVKLPRNKYIRKVDALLAVDKDAALTLSHKNIHEKLGIGHISFVPPMFDATPHLTYQPQEDRGTFFKENFGITIGDYPVITMVANFYENLAHKNHPLLFNAIRILIHDKKQPVHVMLAGDGVRRKYLEDLAKKLDIETFIHFLGFTKNVAGVLHHSDALVHTSGFEAFGIVYLEAGLMHKPSIGALKTAAEHIIEHEKTGFLFKNNDANDLASKIAQLVNNKELIHRLGSNAYNHIMKNLSPDVTFAKYEEIYTATDSRQALAGKTVESP